MAKLWAFLWRIKTLVGVALALLLAGFFLTFAKRPMEIGIDAAYDEGGHRLAVTQTVLYRNPGQKPLGFLLFHIQANAYQSAKTAPVQKGKEKMSYPSGFSPGGLTLDQVLVNGEEAAYSIFGEQGSLLQIELFEPLKEEAEIRLSYTVQLPNARGRLGWFGDGVRLGGAFAVPARLMEDGSFDQSGLPAVGDPNLGEIADYELTLRLPTSFVAAGPGLEEPADDGSWRFRLRDAPELFITLSKNYCVAASRANGVRVRAFAPTEEGAALLAAQGARAVEVYSELFGPYPREDYILATGDLSSLGMEAPGFSLIDARLLRGQSALLEYVVAHETAHQWWGMAVISDQVRHAWQDEALAEYSALLYMEATKGEGGFVNHYNALVRPAAEDSALKGLPIDLPLSSFESEELYSRLVYRLGCAMWHDLRVEMGNAGFFRALSGYYRQHKLQWAEPIDLLGALGPRGARRAKDWLSGEAQPSHSSMAPWGN
ncbi:MAG: M1 family metallopeptidase [Christensenellaceae bacterium]|jgi:hypothetical protein|nr:M1 family metallopeptidase [Christensenellaceae bacterium]